MDQNANGRISCVSGNLECHCAWFFLIISNSDNSVAYKLGFATVTCYYSETLTYWNDCHQYYNCQHNYYDNYYNRVLLFLSFHFQNYIFSSMGVGMMCSMKVKMSCHGIVYSKSRCGSFQQICNRRVGGWGESLSVSPWVGVCRWHGNKQWYPVPEYSCWFRTIIRMMEIPGNMYPAKELKTQTRELCTMSIKVSLKAKPYIGGTFPYTEYREVLPPPHPHQYFFSVVRWQIEIEGSRWVPSIVWREPLWLHYQPFPCQHLFHEVRAARGLGWSCCFHPLKFFVQFSWSLLL